MSAYIVSRKHIEYLVMSAMSQLPAEIREEIEGVHLIYSQGFQELLGQAEDRTIIWSAGGHWSKDRFVVENYGSKQWQWDGEILKPTKGA